MSQDTVDFGEKFRLRALLDHFSVIEDPREPWRVANPLAAGQDAVNLADALAARFHICLDRL
ncbi:hypothetical protein [Rhodospirillum rubrum]|uniref:hypothetical protein n=1 Tax=Rhodospirillum rubrum TaxID=1085 RepID=UPI001905A86B|nr:hypothetical protein [Rhodospirillum rubrum]